MTQQIIQVDPRDLTVHPVAKTLPMPAKDSEEMADLVNNILQIGKVREPLLIFSGKVVNGRKRRAAAILADIQSVPVIEIAEDEIYDAILGPLCLHWNLTKSALAYTIHPLLNPALDESRARRLSNLKIGVSASKPRSGTPCRIGNTVWEIGENYGISERLCRMAGEVRKQFGKDPEGRAIWEGRILAGEMSLGAVLQAIAGRKATLGQPKQLQAEFDLWEVKTKGLVSARMFSTWGKASEKTRRYYAAQIVKAIAEKWPADLQDEIFKTLREKKRAHL